MASDVEHLFMFYWLFVCLEKMSAWIFCPFLTGLCIFLSHKTPLYVLRYKIEVSSQIHDFQVSSPILWSPLLSQVTLLLLLLLLFKKFFFHIYLFLRDRDRAQVGEWQREKETQTPKQAPGSKPSTQSLMRGSNP